MSMQHVYSGENAAGLDVALLGGKAWNLARLQCMGQPVPPWYVIATTAFHEALGETGLDREVAGRLARATGEDEVRETGAWARSQIAGVTIPEAIVRDVMACHAAAGPDGFYAVRSSAAGEDAGGQSFAGIHDSFLFVKGAAEIRSAICRVWASAYNDRALAYRRERRISLDDISIAVVVQRMVDAVASGVMFTVDPVSGNVGRVVVSAVPGAGEGLVSGGLDADTFTVDKATNEMTSQIVSKPERLVFNRATGQGLVRESVPEVERERPALSPEEIGRVAKAGIFMEQAYGRPQDVEFCFDGAGQLFILQARPITTAREYGPAAGNHLIWDNSNITESYSGVTSPMTFSFIRHAYTIVYHCFTSVMGISPRVVKANQHVFENMLGLFRGQVYYNLMNWYRLVRLFPGFNYNKPFMESMMGVKEPVELQGERPVVTALQRYFVELPRLVRLLVRSAGNFLRIRRLVDAFQRNFHCHYERWAAMDFDRKRPDELMAIYRDMENRLLWNWKAPIINDFYVMIFYGMLKRLCVNWCGDEKGSLQNDLICGEGGIESTEPTRLLLGLAALAQKIPTLREKILNDPPERVAVDAMRDPAFSEFAAEVRRYLDQYGFRCMNELKLEEYSLRDRPAFLFTVIRNYLTLDRPETLDIGAIARREKQIRRDAEQRAFEAVGRGRWGWSKLLVFRRVLRNARLGVKNRENMRFARTKIYGMLRQLIRALGRHLAGEGILKDPEDVFYLTIDECWDFVKGTAVTTRLSELATLRRREFEGFRSEGDLMPADRFDSYGMAYHKNLFRPSWTQPVLATDGVLRGTGCCPGEVKGPVKVLKSPEGDMKLAGEILVAERTDPGWVPLYPSVSGVLIERGSILSHSAIVAREMGIPTIVGIPGLTSLLETGQTVRMDGAAGTVEIIKEPTEASSPKPDTSG